jgi:hypothetical protein
MSMPASDAVPSAVAALTRSRRSWMIRAPALMRTQLSTNLGERVPMFFFRYVNKALDALLLPFMHGTATAR